MRLERVVWLDEDIVAWVTFATTAEGHSRLNKDEAEKAVTKAMETLRRELFGE